jgi:hypothetical protein
MRTNKAWEQSGNNLFADGDRSFFIDKLAHAAAKLGWCPTL